MNDVINIYGIILHLVKGKQEFTCGCGMWTWAGPVSDSGEKKKERSFFNNNNNNNNNK